MIKNQRLRFRFQNQTSPQQLLEDLSPAHGMQDDQWQRRHFGSQKNSVDTKLQEGGLESKQYMPTGPSPSF